jgi:hypothetical protein
MNIFLLHPYQTIQMQTNRMTMNHSLRTFLSSIKPLNWIKFDIVELCSTVDKFSHLRISFHSTTIVVHLKKMWEAFSFFSSQTNMKFVIRPRCLFEIACFFNQINVSQPNPCIHLIFLEKLFRITPIYRNWHEYSTKIVRYSSSPFFIETRFFYHKIKIFPI